MFESQVTTLEACEPTVSDIALQLMVASRQGGDYEDCETAFRNAEKFVAERDKRAKASISEKVGEILAENNMRDANGWNAYPEVRPTSRKPVLVRYADARYGVENPTTDINGTWFFASTCGVLYWQSIKE